MCSMGTTQPKRCLTCGYILDHLPEPRCPECGRAFNPADAATCFTRAVSGLRYMLIAVSGCVLVVVGFFLWGSSLSVHGRWLARVVDFLVVLLMVVGFVSLMFAGIRSAEALRRPRYQLTCRWAAFTACALVVLPAALCALAVLRTCLHAG